MVAVRAANSASDARSGIDGHVVDATGAPAPRAMVRAVARGASDDDNIFAGVASVITGNYTLDLRAGDYIVTVSAVGTAPSSVAITVPTGGRIRVNLQLGAAAPIVKGHISDMNGGPVVGALIIAASSPGILSADDEHGVIATSDATGAFELSAPVGRYLISAQHPDYVGTTRSIEVGSDGLTVDLSLAPGSVIEGVVLDGSTGVAAATVEYHREVERVGMLENTFAASTDQGTKVTDADGHFRITGLSGGRIVLSAHADDGRATGAPTEIDLGIADTSSDVKLHVIARPMIRGRVVYLDGKPAVRANVSVQASRNIDDVSVADDGTFQIVGLSPGQYKLTAQAEDSLKSEALTVELKNAAVASVVLKVARGEYVNGRVEPPMAADVFEVRAAPQGGRFDESRNQSAADVVRVRSENDGTFRLGPFAPGAHTIGARASDGRHGEAVVQLPTTASVAIALQGKGIIAGQVVASDGKPLTGVTVSIAKINAENSANVTIVNGMNAAAEHAPVDATGHFEIAGREPGQWSLAVLDERGGLLNLHDDARSTMQTVTLAADAPRVDTKIVVDKPDGELHGHVIDKSGNAVADAWVTIDWVSQNGESTFGSFANNIANAPPPRKPKAEPPPPLSDSDDNDDQQEMTTMTFENSSDGVRAGAIPAVLTSTDGSFSFTGLRRGYYRVTAEANRGASRGMLASVMTGSDAKVAVVSLATITGSVTIDGGPVTDFQLEVRGPMSKERDVYSPDGSFSVTGLDAGKYEVSVHTDTGSGRATVSVAEGQTATVHVALRLDGTIVGVVVDANQQPVVKALVFVAPQLRSVSETTSTNHGVYLTDSTGHFSTPSEAGAMKLTVMGTRKTGMVELEVDVPSGSTIDVGTLVTER